MIGEIDSSYDEIEYDKVNNEIFHNAKFNICIGLNELDTVISTDNKIIIKCSHTCYCYKLNNNKRSANYYTVYNINNIGITNQMIIQALIDNNYDPRCNHIFLEFFDQNIKISSKYVKQFEPFFGS